VFFPYLDHLIDDLYAKYTVRSTKFVLSILSAIVVIVGVLLYMKYGRTYFPTSLLTQQNQQLSITSQVHNLDVSFSNKSYLEKKLTELNLWEGEKKNYDTNITIFADIKALNIVITTEKQKLNQVVKADTDPPQVYQSTGLTYDPSLASLTMYIHLDQEFIDKLNEEKLAKIFSSMILRRAYGIKNPVDTNQDGEYAASSESFLQVSKK